VGQLQVQIAAANPDSGDGGGSANRQVSTTAGAGADPLVTTEGLAATSVSQDGQTIVIHNLTPGQLTNLVVNTADNRTIQQDVQVNITLPGFADVQQSQLFASMGMKINADAGLGFIGALAH
jgi:prolyl-tRNA synthetase